MRNRNDADGKRYGLKVGDKVVPTREYLQENNKAFTATIDRFLYPMGNELADLAEVVTADEKRFTISCYWLEKDPCTVCLLGVDGVCIPAEDYSSAVSSKSTGA